MDIYETVKLRKRKCGKSGIEHDTCIVGTKELDDLLNELKVSQEETQQVLDDYQNLGKEYYKVCCELELAERVINLMAEYIKKPYEVISNGGRKRKIQIIKEYFYKKAEAK